MDAILGDLCALEMQLTSAQTELDTRMQRKDPIQSSTLTKPMPAAPLVGATNAKPPVLTKPVKNAKKPPQQHAQAAPVVAAGASGDDWDDVINSQLQGALDALTDLSVNDDLDTSGDDVTNAAHRVIPPAQLSRVTEISATPQRKTSAPMSSLLTPPRSIAEASAQSVVPVMGDLSPISNLDLDSAYGDSTSLPSSESHVSVANHVMSSQHGPAPGVPHANEADTATMSQVGNVQ